VSFPASLDSIPQPGAGSLTNNPSHAGTHVLEITAIQALEAKVGTGASTPVASTLLRGTGTGTTAYAQAVLTTDVAGTLPVANGGSGVTSSTGTGSVVLSTSPALTTPTGIVKGDVGLGNVDNTSDATKNAATVALTNKTISGANNTLTNIGGSAITSYSTNRGNNGSNIAETVAKVQTGWVATQGNGTGAAGGTITFPVAFTNVPIVTITFGGDTAGVTATLGAGGANVNGAWAIAKSLTTTGFAWTVNTSGGTWSTSNTVYAQWTAIGA